VFACTAIGFRRPPGEAACRKTRPEAIPRTGSHPDAPASFDDANMVESFDDEAEVTAALEELASDADAIMRTSPEAHTIDGALRQLRRLLADSPARPRARSMCRKYPPSAVRRGRRGREQDQSLDVSGYGSGYSIDSSARSTSRSGQRRCSGESLLFAREEEEPEGTVAKHRRAHASTTMSDLAVD
jgi:hypothetical protein